MHVCILAALTGPHRLCQLARQRHAAITPVNKVLIKCCKKECFYVPPFTPRSADLPEKRLPAQARPRAAICKLLRPRNFLDQSADDGIDRAFDLLGVRL